MITLGKSFDGGKTFIVPHPPMNGIPPTIPTACCATALLCPPSARRTAAACSSSAAQEPRGYNPQSISTEEICGYKTNGSAQSLKGELLIVSHGKNKTRIL